MPIAAAMPAALQHLSSTIVPRISAIKSVRQQTHGLDFRCDQFLTTFTNSKTISGMAPRARSSNESENGSAVVLGFLQAFGIALAEVEGFVADIGPGSFTGVRVGVMLV
ncbi:MAG: hypothetical protein H7Y36_04795, partial [Armatimonadetes bacterium]|nr:hypothetical protein [Akkermansiaceae bacterium]